MLEVTIGIMCILACLLIVIFIAAITIEMVFDALNAYKNYKNNNY